jgi:hypothetical protein
MEAAMTLEMFLGGFMVLLVVAGIMMVMTSARNGTAKPEHSSKNRKPQTVAKPKQG